MSKQFGAKVTDSNIKEYSRSKNWDGEKFMNLEETEMKIPFRAFPKLIYKQLFGRKNNQLKELIKSIPFDKEAFLSDSDKTKFIWYGHSAILMRMQNQTILIDPMLGPDAAPVAPFKIKRFNDVSLDLISELPEIDLLILSHDHYDHLDLKSIELLKPKVKKYFVALGVGRHLIHWGVETDKIKEFDWWEQQKFEDIQITFTPTRHFSGRGLSDRFKGLWGGWTFKTETENIWFSGDGGYGNHFKEIGERLGPFDFAFMECGQYNKLWRPIHLFPNECVQAAIDAKADVIMPVHWGSFTLSDHGWTDSVEEFVSTCKNQKINFQTPKIGELIYLNIPIENSYWWRELT